MTATIMTMAYLPIAVMSVVRRFSLDNFVVLFIVVVRRIERDILSGLLECEVGHSYSHVLAELLVRDGERCVRVFLIVASFTEDLGRRQKVPLAVMVHLSNFIGHILDAIVGGHN